MTTVTLATEQAHLVEQLIANGLFTSADEAVNSLLAEALGGPPEYSAAELAKLQLSVDEADRGELVSQAEVDAFFADWRRND